MSEERQNAFWALVADLPRPVRWLIGLAAIAGPSWLGREQVEKLITHWLMPMYRTSPWQLMAILFGVLCLILGYLLIRSWISPRSDVSTSDPIYDFNGRFRFPTDGNLQWRAHAEMIGRADDPQVRVDGPYCSVTDCGFQITTRYHNVPRGVCTGCNKRYEFGVEANYLRIEAAQYARGLFLKRRESFSLRGGVLAHLKNWFFARPSAPKQ